MISIMISTYPLYSHSDHVPSMSIRPTVTHNAAGNLGTGNGTSPAAATTEAQSHYHHVTNSTVFIGKRIYLLTLALEYVYVSFQTFAFVVFVCFVVIFVLYFPDASLYLSTEDDEPTPASDRGTPNEPLLGMKTFFTHWGLNEMVFIC